MPQRVFTTWEVARICDVHQTTIINWVNEGKLPAYATPGGHRRIKSNDLREFMKRYRIPAAEKLDRQEKRVLIVDDDEHILEELSDALSGNGFVLDLASSGFEAARKIYSVKPDLIILDFKMPGMDGFRVCEIMKNDKETSSIPIIAYTGLNYEEDIKRIKDHGVREYIPKPGDVDKLLRVITRILRIRAKKET